MSLQGWLFWFLSLCVKLCDDITSREKDHLLNGYICFGKCGVLDQLTQK